MQSARNGTACAIAVGGAVGAAVCQRRLSSHVRTPDGRWHKDENAFVTAQVLRTLDYTAQTAPHIELALDFLLSCESRPHHFHFGLPASTRLDGGPADRR